MQPPGYPPPGGQPPYGHPQGGYPQGGYPQGGYPQGGPGGAYGAPPGGYRPPPQKDPIDSKATTALIISLVGVVLCCAPAGIVGGFFGYKAMGEAKAQNRPSPGKAVASVILGALSLLMMIGVIVAYQIDQKHRAERMAAADEATKGKLEGKNLEKKVACALLEKQLLRGLYDDKQSVDDYSCKGDLDVDKEKGVATLHEVNGTFVTEKKVLTACFAKARRWFAVSAFEGAGTCPTIAFESKLGKNASDEELDKEEDEFRKDAKSAADKALVADFEKKLLKARDAVTGDDHKEKACGKLDISKFTGDTRLVVATADIEELKDLADTKEDWSFLTSDSIKRALKQDAKIEERAAAVREVLKGPWLVVYTAEERDWPQPTKGGGLFKKKGFLGGGFGGWLTIVDTRDATVVCEAPFSFENSKSVAVSKYASDKELSDALRGDLKKNYETAAPKKLREMTDKLRLGFSALD